MRIEKNIESKVKKLLQTMPQNLGTALNIEFQSFARDEVKAVMPVDKNTIQPFGILHGGASVALAETIVSIGAWLNIDETKKAAVGIEINANHLRAVKKGGYVLGTGSPIHIGNKTQVWEVKIRTQKSNKLVCISRCTLAIVDRKF
jgi:1,4-dihydroxy-2-naphthoyl-CoA hydrolase